MPLRWQVSYVAVWVGWDEPPSLAFTSTGAPGIACYASDSSQLNFYEVNANGFWVANPVDAQVNNSSSVSCSLAFHFNRPSIAYCVYDGFPAQPDLLRYAHRDGLLAFNVTDVGPAQRSGSSLAFAPNGLPSIAFYNANPGGTGYRQAGPSAWTGSAVDPKGTGGNISLAFTPTGHPAIAYMGGTDDGQTRLIKYAVFDGLHWRAETVAEGDNSPSLGFDPSGSPTIVYGVQNPMAVMCARRGSSAWQISKVVDWGDSPSLAFTPAGDPAIAYVDLVYDAAVKYAVYRNGWKHYLVDQPSKQQAAFRGWYYWYYPSLAFNPVTGEPAIAYFQYGGACIKYAVGRFVPRGFGDIVTDIVTAMARMVARWTRPRPPVPLPPERERFRLAASADGGDGPRTAAQSASDGIKQQ
jgi:hypothetical protein